LYDPQQLLKADIDQLAEYFDERENGIGTELNPYPGTGAAGFSTPVRTDL
jgi:hypothetical protein